MVENNHIAESLSWAVSSNIWCRTEGHIAFLLGWGRGRFGFLRSCRNRFEVFSVQDAPFNSTGVGGLQDG